MSCMGISRTKYWTSCWLKFNFNGEFGEIRLTLFYSFWKKVVKKSMDMTLLTFSFSLQTSNSTSIFFFKFLNAWDFLFQIPFFIIICSNMSHKQMGQVEEFVKQVEDYGMLRRTRKKKRNRFGFHRINFIYE